MEQITERKILIREVVLLQLIQRSDKAVFDLERKVLIFGSISVD